jgi:hypothetical protein
MKQKKSRWRAAAETMGQKEYAGAHVLEAQATQSLITVTSSTKKTRTSQQNGNANAYDCCSDAWRIADIIVPASKLI